jgi:hypothetical protein
MEARTVTRIRLTRTARGAVIALALALVVAAPVDAAPPTRTLIVPTSLVRHFPAGDGCTFDVTVYLTPGARTTITDFSDGTEVNETHSMKRTITNDATGATFVENQSFHDVEWLDPATGLIHGITNGQAISQFYPGDIGPYGVVDQPVAYLVYGTQWWAWDTATNHQTAFSYTGTLTDICAAIS